MGNLQIIILLIYLAILLSPIIYTSFAFMSLAKKTGTEKPWLAFIPIAKIYLVSKIAQMSSWPMLLLLIIVPSFFLIYFPWAAPLTLVALISGLIFFIFTLIWEWKVFERVGCPGWWVLTFFIPIVGPIVYFVLLGIAAWGKNKKDICKEINHDS